MKHARTTLAAAVAVLLAASACADGSELGPQSERDPAEQQQEEDEADEAAEEGDAPEELEVDEDEADTAAWQFVEEFDEPVVYEDNGVRLSITGVGINDATSDELPSEVVSFLDDGVETIVVLEMTASNDSGEAINLYANQGTIQLGREQVEADMFFSDSFAGSEFRDGVDDDGQVFWMLSNTSWEDAIAAGELTYVASAPSSAETWDSIASEIELTVTWDAP